MISSILEALEKEQEETKQKRRKKKAKSKRLCQKNMYTDRMPKAINRYRRNSFYSKASPRCRKIDEIVRHRYEKDNNLLATRLENVFNRKPQIAKKPLKIAINRASERHFKKLAIQKGNEELASRLIAVKERKSLYGREIKNSKHDIRLTFKKFEEQRAKQASVPFQASMTEADFQTYCNKVNSDTLQTGQEFQFINKAEPSIYIRSLQSAKKARSPREKMRIKNFQNENLRLYRRLSNVKATILPGSPGHELKSKKKSRRRASLSARSSRFETMSTKTLEGMTSVKVNFKSEEAMILERLQVKLQEAFKTQNAARSTNDDVNEKHLFPNAFITSPSTSRGNQNEVSFNEREPKTARTLQQFVLSRQSKAFNSLKSNLTATNTTQSKSTLRLSEIKPSPRRRLSVSNVNPNEELENAQNQLYVSLKMRGLEKERLKEATSVYSKSKKKTRAVNKEDK